jgi:hypothetical protein
MGGARHTILVKSKQMQKMSRHHHGSQMLDAVNILHFSDSLQHDYFRLLKK